MPDVEIQDSRCDLDSPFTTAYTFFVYSRVTIKGMTILAGVRRFKTRPASPASCPTSIARAMFLILLDPTSRNVVFNEPLKQRLAGFRQSEFYDGLA
jgi:hypothetical protein